MGINKDRAESIKNKICAPGADDFGVCVARAALIDALNTTKMPVSKIISAHLPLNRDRTVTQKDVDYINDLAEEIEGSDEDTLERISVVQSAKFI
jgi:hypothetical protein